MIHLVENATTFTAEELCRHHPPVQVEYVKIGCWDLVKKQDIVSLVQTILRGIECKIGIAGASKRTPKCKSGCNSSSESNSGGNDNGRGSGHHENGKDTNMCRIPG